MRSLARSLGFNGALVALVAAGALACSAGHNKTGGGDDLDAGDDGGFGFDVNNEGGGDSGLVFHGLAIDPPNGVITINTSTTPATPAVQPYKITLFADDGSSSDVSATAAMSVEDPTLGTFAGSTFTSALTLPGGVLGISTIVHATSGTKAGAANLTIVMLRKGGTGTDGKKDFFFVVPYMGAPSPTRDVLKFGTNIQQVDVAFTLDTTGSMGSVIANAKTSISAMIPALGTAIKNVGIAIDGHDDFPYDGHGSPPDMPFYLLQTVTTDAKLAKAATDTYALHNGDDWPEAQLEAAYQVFAGDGVAWTGGSIPKHVNKPGTYGGVDFRPGSLPVMVEITDSQFHPKADYASAGKPEPHSIDDVKAAIKKVNGRYVGIAISAASSISSFEDEKILAQASKSYVPPAAFGKPGCGAGQCCTEEGGLGRPPDAADGKSCLLVFKAPYTGTGSTDGIVKAIAAVSVGSQFDVTAKASNDPSNAINPDTGSVVDATLFIQSLRAMDEGDAANGCPAHPAVDTDADTIKDTFTAVLVGTPVCFEVLPKMNTSVKPKSTAQFFNAFIDVLGMPGAVKLDRRTVLFLVPPTDIVVK